MGRICLYYRREPDRDRWLPGDRFVRPSIRRLLRGRPRASGVDKVFTNLCLGLERLGVPFVVNLPFDQLRNDDQVGVLGVGRYALKGYDRPNSIVAGIGLMTHPTEWPTLCDDYPIAAYLQHSDWANALFKRHFGDCCRTWAVGIDTEWWKPESGSGKSIDVLIYDKIRWDRERLVSSLLDPLRTELQRRQLTYTELRYGFYSERKYKDALRECRSMVFVCEHESQGLAYLECLASGVPILAWDQGRCLDLNRFAWGEPDIPATSVPFFDQRCGLTFRNVSEFPRQLDVFRDLIRSGIFAPRDYVIENLTLEKCSSRFLDILNETADQT